MLDVEKSEKKLSWELGVFKLHVCIHPLYIQYTIYLLNQ
jgi:hypothetical protein